MDLFQEITNLFSPLLSNIWVKIFLLIAFATVHGYVGAWVAVRMLFRPRRPFKVLGITLFPQGMIPRHRERLAKAIGKAVGEELVSQETIMEELLGKDFLRRKIRVVVDSYVNDLVSKDHPSLIEVLPATVRAPVLDALAALQFKIAEHIEIVLKSDESLEAIRGFVTRRVDEFLSKRASELIDEASYKSLIEFLDGRIDIAINSTALEARVREFIDRRVEEVVNAETSLGALLTDDAVNLLKEKAAEQIEPVVHRLTELAAEERTRNQIGALIKHEVHEYYEALPFFKKIFVSRENLLNEVDDLVNESLPRRIEETLKGDFFADEARNFIEQSITNAMQRPLTEVVGKIAPDQLARLKEQIARSVLSLIRGEQLRASISDYISASLDALRPHSLDAIMQTLHPESEEKLKNMLSKGLLHILSRDETSQIINSVLADQIDTLLAKPIGRLTDVVSEERIRAASEALSENIMNAIREKLPDAIREFDVGSVVREKINAYPVEKLEALVLSVAKEHLRKIELFGALLGLILGLGQAVWAYFAFTR